MRILFFVDPVIEWNQPSRKLWWLYQTVAMMTLIEPDRTAWPARFRILTSDWFAHRARSPLSIPLAGLQEAGPIAVPPECIVALSRADLRQSFDADGARFLKAWYEEQVGPAGRQAMSERLRERAGHFQPDMVIAFNIAPFLKDAWPDAVFLDHDAGLLTQPPFSSSLFLDPCGKLRHGFIRRFGAALTERPPAPGAALRVERLRRRYLDGILRPRSPFGAQRDAIRGRFSSVWMVPTHLEPNPVLGELPHQTFLDYLSWVLDSVGPDVGIVVSQHPNFQQLMTPDVVEYLTATHPNFIPVEGEWAWACSSHFLFDLVDGVIGLDTSVIGHALLWGRKIVTLTDNHMTGFADSRSLDGLSRLAREPLPAWREGLLDWLLTCYYIPAAYMYRPGFLAARLATFLERARRGIDADFFDPIDDPDTVFDLLIEQADDQVPRSQLNNRMWLPTPQLIQIFQDEIKAVHEQKSHLLREATAGFLLQTGRLCIAPFDGGSEPATLGVPAARMDDPAVMESWRRLAASPRDARAALDWSHALVGLGLHEAAAKTLVWGLLLRQDDAVRADAAVWLREAPELFRTLWPILAATSAERWRRLRTPVPIPPPLIPGARLAVDGLRRDGVAGWAGLADRLDDAGLHALLGEVVAQAYRSDVAPVAVESDHPPAGAEDWRVDGCADTVQVTILLDRRGAEPPILEVLAGSHLAATAPMDALHAAFGGGDGRVEAPPDGRMAIPLARPGDAVLLDGLCVHRWRTNGAHLLRLSVWPDTLRNRALHPPRRAG